MRWVAREDPAEHVYVDVSARDDGDDSLVVREVLGGGGHGAGSGSLRNHVCLESQCANRLADAVDRHDEGAVEQRVRERPHVHEYTASSNAVDERWRAVDGYGFARSE